jgi:hypothetical protein
MSSIAAGPTCRFLSVHPDWGFMLSGDQPSLNHFRHPCACDAPTWSTRRDGRSRTLTAAPGFGPQAIRAAQTLFVHAGRCCPGLWLLLQVFGHRRAFGATCIAREEYRVDRQSRRFISDRYPLVGFDGRR